MLKINARTSVFQVGGCRHYILSEWEAYYKEHFVKFQNKLTESVDNKREMQYQHLMQSAGSGNKIDRQSRVEDRLLKEGEKYMDKLNIIR